MATALALAAPDIHTANDADLSAATAAHLEPALVGRLALDASKLATAVDGVRQVAALPDPVGEVRRATTLDDGLRLWQVTCPLGVVACIFESRPDVVIQITALAVRSGNAVLLKGGKEATRTNQALVEVLRKALDDAGLPADAVQLLEGREEVSALLDLDDLVDLVIPRGGNELVRHIQEHTRIPVLGHAAGVCSIYIHEDADADMAKRIVVDAKTDYPSACNAVETLLIHEAWPHRADLLAELEAADVVVHDQGRLGHEWGSLDVTLASVSGLDEAMALIAAHGSGHTDCILTTDEAVAKQFLAAVDSAGVYWNASTRFADGYRYGLGAEVGISTGKIHARGPVGLEGLVSTRWLLVGNGHVAADYKAKAFRHDPLSEAPPA